MMSGHPAGPPMAECQIPQMLNRNTVKPPDLVMVVGGEGALGGKLFYSLLKAEFNIRCLVRLEDEHLVDRKPGVEFFYCDPIGGEIPDSAFEGVKFVINAVSPLNTGSVRTRDVEAVERLNNILITRAKSRGVQRYLLLSSLSLSAEQRQEEDWANVSWRLEFSVLNSGIPFTIMRSGILLGETNAATLHSIARGGGLLSVFARKVERFYITPVEMLAEAFASAVRIEQSVNKTYAVVLKEAISRKQLGQVAGRARAQPIDPWEAEIQPVLASGPLSDKLSNISELEMAPESFSSFIRAT